MICFSLEGWFISRSPLLLGAVLGISKRALSMYQGFSVGDPDFCGSPSLTLIPPPDRIKLLKVLFSFSAAFSPAPSFFLRPSFLAPSHCLLISKCFKQKVVPNEIPQLLDPGPPNSYVFIAQWLKTNFKIFSHLS